MTERRIPLLLTLVPNAPCGVESPGQDLAFSQPYGVPNAPCGVESVGEELKLRSEWSFLMHRVELKGYLHSSDEVAFTLFLMHRVELKDQMSIGSHSPFSGVPNAPCGVESLLHL